MKKLAIAYRAAQFYAHAAHNLSHGPTFHEDHEFFGEAYGIYESAYDDLIERMIGLGQSPDIAEITKLAAKDMAEYQHGEVEKCYEHLLEYELEFLDYIKSEMPKLSLGTQNLLQQLADDSEKRQYKIQQRLK